MGLPTVALWARLLEGDTVTPCAFHDLIPIFSLSIQLHQTHQNLINWNLIESTPITITHIPLVHRKNGEVIYGLMIPARYIGSWVYTADTMTYYSTLPTVFYFSEWAPLSISYSSLLFKPPCIPSYFSSFQIELRTGPLLIPIISLRVLLCPSDFLLLSIPLPSSSIRYSRNMPNPKDI